MKKPLIINSSKAEEANVTLLNVTVSREDFEHYLELAYQKRKSGIEVPGYRKGKAPRRIVETVFGRDMFLQDALEMAVPDVADELARNKDLGILTFGRLEVLQAGTDKELILTVEVVTEPEVTLGQYKELKRKKMDTAVSDRELAEEIENELKKSATKSLAFRPVENGDEVILDFKGFVDGVAFEGGEGEGYALVIGSHAFIPGFEEQLIGAKIDEDVKVNVVFPENYHAENLKGKPAVFECRISSISEFVVPEANDEYAKNRGYESFAEFENDVKTTMSEKKKAAALDEIQEMLINMASANAEVHVPAALIESAAKDEMDRFEQRINQQGLNMDMYFEYTGSTRESLMEEAMKASAIRLRAEYVLKAIAQKENITASEEEVNKAIENVAKSYGMPVDDIKKALGDALVTGVTEDIVKEKAINLLVRYSVEE